MAEEFDIEALLEAPYSKKDASSKSRENDDGRTSSRKSKKRSRSRSRDRDRNDRARSRDRDRKNRDEKRSKRRSRSKSRDKDKEKEKEKDKDKHRRRKSRSKDRRRSPSPLLLGPRREREKQTNNNFRFDDLTPEERDARTVFCMQLSQRVRARDLEEFFSSVGKVRDVRLIMCNKTRRFKGISYVEFRDPESVALAMGLSGQKLLGVPIVVQHTQAEKNRQGNSMISMMSRGASGPCKLYVGSLHFNITEDMLRGIFEPFGKIDSIQLQMDPETGRSRGYGFVTYRDAEDAKRALEQLNGFELAGRPMKVNTVTEKNEFFQMNPALLDTDETDRAGIDLGATGRLQLMAKLAEGTGMTLPAAATSALNATAQQPLITAQQAAMAQATAPPIATQCFMLSNMFDPAQESAPFWDTEIRDDVIEECNKHGGVLHVYVDTVSPQGNCYVKCPTIATAVAAVNSLHGRWFAGRVITAAYVPVVNYHSLFPDAMTVTTPLQPNRK